MARDKTGEILERLKFVADARKSFDTVPKWEPIPYRSGRLLILVVALRLDGILRGGVQLRLKTPEDTWEDDVYGQIEVRLPAGRRSLRLNPVEWRPMRHHDNPPNAPNPHRNQRLWDRWHPFDLNEPYGLRCFDQTSSGIAVPLPREVGSFNEYTDLCSSLWHCPDLIGLTPPPWTRDLI